MFENIIVGLLNEYLRAEITTRVPLATRLTYLAGTMCVLMDELAGLLLPCAVLVFPSSLPVPSLHPVLLGVLSALCLACICRIRRIIPEQTTSTSSSYPATVPTQDISALSKQASTCTHATTLITTCHDTMLPCRPCTALARHARRPAHLVPSL